MSKLGRKLIKAAKEGTQSARFEAATEPKGKTLNELVIEFFEVLDKIETKDSGTEFRPNYISSCRVMDTAKLGKLIPRMKELAKASSQ